MKVRMAAHKTALLLATAGLAMAATPWARRRFVTWGATPDEAAGTLPGDDLLPDVQPEQILRVSIEAGTTLGWERYTMLRGLRFGIDGFGASAPAPDLYRHFGLTPDQIAPKIIAALNASKEQA